MKVLVSWLREFVSISSSPEEIANAMSVRGFAVESIEHIGDNAPAGASAKADAVLDFEVMANRPDCMSVIGIAREVATAYGVPLKDPGFPRAKDPGASSQGPALDIVIESPELCPRYVGAVASVTDVTSPEWMQARLRASGVRPISAIVDVTNYVMLERGQPMHAFDYERIGGRQIRIRTARPGERLRTLDGESRTLSPEMLVIADANRAIAIAGVMGGADSEVTDSTRTIVFESAYFDPLSVRRTSKALGLKTEASMRFERGVDPELAGIAMARACALLESIGVGTTADTPIDCHPLRKPAVTLDLRRGKIAGLLGMAVPDEDVARILTSLGFALKTHAEGWSVEVPTRRVDVAREVDLIEEVARHYGFDRLPATFPALDVAPPPLDPHVTQARQLRAVMTGSGFSEAVTFGFIPEAPAQRFAAAGDLVAIANPLAETFAVLRPSILPGLLDAVAHNRRREQRDVRLFEVGTRFSRAAGERRAIACAWTGLIGDHWSGAGRAVDFFDVKGVVERVCDALGVHITTEPMQASWLVPGRAASVVANGTEIGMVGLVDPSIIDQHDLPHGDAVYVAEIDLDAVEAARAGGDFKVQALPRHPSVTRDISILVDDTLASAHVRRTITSVAPSTLVRIREFDRYQGKGIPEGKVSLSLRLTFRSPDRTLTDAEVQSAMDAVIDALKTRHGAIQR